MKPICFLIYFFLLYGISAISQVVPENYQYSEDYPFTELGNNSYISFQVNERAPSPVKRFIDNIPEDSTKLFNQETLNVLFVSKLGTAFGGSNDLSLQEFYFSLDASDNSLSLAYNFDNRKGKELTHLNWVYSIGAKLKSSDNFSIISNSGDLQEDNIGLTGAISFIGNGKINWYTSINEKKNSHRQEIEKNRKFLYYEFEAKVKKFNDEELKKLAEYEKTFESYDTEHQGLQKALDKKADELYLEMIKNDLEFIDKNKSFNYLFDWWATLNVFIPLGDVNYDITPITNDNKATKVNYYAFDTNVSLNGYWETSWNLSFFGKFKFGVRGNNNIAVNEFKPKQFQSIIDNDGQQEITFPVSAIQVDEFDKFITPSTFFEFAVFYKNFIGLSPAIEKNFGTYNGTNWKLGIPVSLKDKEGNPTVNFEIQWRKDTTLESSIHRIGISTNFQFGSLIKNNGA